MTPATTNMTAGVKSAVCRLVAPGLSRIGRRNSRKALLKQSAIDPEDLEGQDNPVQFAKYGVPMRAGKIPPSQPYIARLRGLVPVQRRKAREKALGSEKPTR